MSRSRSRSSSRSSKCAGKPQRTCGLTRGCTVARGKKRTFCRKVSNKTHRRGKNRGRHSAPARLGRSRGNSRRSY